MSSETPSLVDRKLMKLTIAISLLEVRSSTLSRGRCSKNVAKLDRISSASSPRCEYSSEISDRNPCKGERRDILEG